MRRSSIVERLAFLCVIGVRADDEKMEVLFQSLGRRGLDMTAVELGIMDGLAAFESAFCAAFSCARTQRCQVHATLNALGRVSIRDRDAFKVDLGVVFYAKTEAKARLAFTGLTAKWKPKYPGAFGVIGRGLDSLLRFSRERQGDGRAAQTSRPQGRTRADAGASERRRAGLGQSVRVLQ